MVQFWQLICQGICFLFIGDLDVFQRRESCLSHGGFPLPWQKRRSLGMNQTAKIVSVSAVFGVLGGFGVGSSM
jgi:hypothetical protein